VITYTIKIKTMWYNIQEEILF